ncbi:MAG TPA: hypothetical protein VLI90_01040 [Tepidisphaeraceae bacterium]|nr:hypothetical protein [Tepidisphaeraceae bacterium]
MNDPAPNHDLPCPGCGYNLRGVPYDHPCPECGLNVQRQPPVGIFDSAKRRATPTVEDFDRQQDELALAAERLLRADEALRRHETLLARWEQLITRIERILDRMEKHPPAE